MSKKKKETLTVRQAQIFKFIKRYQSKHGYPPTRKEITNQLQFKSGNATSEQTAGRLLDNRY